MNEFFPQIVFTSPGKAELLQVSKSELPADPQSTLIETEYSIISPGTELACLSGKESWAPLPFRPGYGSVGRVIQAGKREDLAVGQRVFTFGAHGAYGAAQVICLPLSEGTDPAQAVFARMAAVSITALRVSDVALGDTVAVFGLGPVGNLAAQLFALSGCRVIGIDLSEKRREVAQQCGIPHVLASGADIREQVTALTGGRLCRTVVEATGLSAVAEQAIALAGKQGEMILLGSPRAAHNANLTSFLNHIHLWGDGCVTVKGAHEWRFPIGDGEHVRHSIERNVQIILGLIAEKKLQVAPLLTHRLSPADCQTAYDGLLKEKDRYLGVIFDWSKA